MKQLSPTQKHLIRYALYKLIEKYEEDFSEAQTQAQKMIGERLQILRDKYMPFVNDESPAKIITR